MTARPFYWGDTDRRLFGEANPALTRGEVLLRYAEYAQNEEQQVGEWTCRMTCFGTPWRRGEGVAGRLQSRRSVRGGCLCSREADSSAAGEARDGAVRGGAAGEALPGSARPAAA
jgi:hypothetical protein